MKAAELPAGVMERHLRSMRVATAVFVASLPFAVAAILLLPARESMASPFAVSLVAAAAALWVGFTANRDAQQRIDRIKRAFAVHGDPLRLLADHRMVNLAVLARLEVMVVAAVIAGLWGSMSAVPWGLLALAAIMMALSWPTADKSSTLLARAQELRGRE